MPYNDNAELLQSVRDYLPEHAQTIYREAFNHASVQYAHDLAREEIAHRMAWERGEAVVPQGRRALGPQGLTTTAGTDGTG